MSQVVKNKVLLIGWDAADWKVIKPLMDKGHMPTLKKFIDEGAHGDLRTLNPPLSPILWTSIATGMRAYDHGIYGFVEADKETKSITQIKVTTRKRRTLWNILGNQGYKTNVVGWWPSYPAEPVNGVCVSDWYSKVHKNLTMNQHDDLVHPPVLNDTLKQLRILPTQLAAEHILPFVPNLEKVQQSNDKRPFVISKILCECINNHSAATWAMDNTEWDFMAIYQPDIDHFGHGFMKYNPPRKPNIKQEDFDNYNGVVAAAYRLHDMMLETILSKVDDNTTVVICSDHGFHPDHHRPLVLPKEPAGPADEHSPYGILAIKGPNIKSGVSIKGAGLLDIAPTILSLCGLPVGADMEGTPITYIMKESNETKYIPSWEEVTGNFFEHAKDTLNSETNDAAPSDLKQLIDLGYVEELSGDFDVDNERVSKENRYNLAKVYMGAVRYEAAIKLLLELHGEYPEEGRFMVNLWHCYLNIKKYELAQTMVTKLASLNEKDKLLLKYLTAKIDIEKGDLESARKTFEHVVGTKRYRLNIWADLGNAYKELKLWDKSQGALEKAIKIAPQNAKARYDLGYTLFQQKQYDAAISSLMEAINLSFSFPRAHFLLGECLMKLKQYEAARNAYQVVLKLTPDMVRAHRKLTEIYVNHLPNPSLAAHHKEQIKSIEKSVITIVSGIPRSGTSMMMQILEAGGLQVFTDNTRKPDQNNPRGYYEHQSIKKIARSAQFVVHSVGKLMKVIGFLLPNLPSKFKYRIVYMERDLEEIMHSQQKMLNKPTDSYNYGMATQFQKQDLDTKQWMDDQPNVEYIVVKYTNVISQPHIEIDRIKEFLGDNIDVSTMLDQVDPPYIEVKY